VATKDVRLQSCCWGSPPDNSDDLETLASMSRFLEWIHEFFILTEYDTTISQDLTRSEVFNRYQIDFRKHGLPFYMPIKRTTDVDFLSDPQRLKLNAYKELQNIDLADHVYARVNSFLALWMNLIDRLISDQTSETPPPDKILKFFQVLNEGSSFFIENQYLQKNFNYPRWTPEPTFWPVGTEVKSLLNLGKFLKAYVTENKSLSDLREKIIHEPDEEDFDFYPFYQFSRAVSSKREERIFHQLLDLEGRSPLSLRVKKLYMLYLLSTKASVEKLEKKHYMDREFIFFVLNFLATAEDLLFSLLTPESSSDQTQGKDKLLRRSFLELETYSMYSEKDKIGYPFPICFLPLSIKKILLRIL
jgi:hypothetical protein